MNVLATNNYLCRLPDAWAPDSTVLLSGPAGSAHPFIVSIKTVTATEGATAESLGQEILAGFSAAENPVEVLSSGLLSLQNCTGFAIHTQWPDKAGKRFHQYQLIVVQEANAFILMTSLAADVFQEVKDEVESIFRSFQTIE